MTHIEQKLDRIEKLLLNKKTVLDIDELARYANLSTSYLYKLTSTGEIPFYKPRGKKIYFKKSEIDDWLLSNKHQCQNEIDGLAEDYLMDHPL